MIRNGPRNPIENGIAKARDYEMNCFSLVVQAVN